MTCPACRGPLTTVALQCAPCDLKVEGKFPTFGPNSGPTSEFQSLKEDELHFLRIFIHCEGSIREMESALGVSYPTIKARIAALKEKLSPIAPTSHKNESFAEPQMFDSNLSSNLDSNSPSRSTLSKIVPIKGREFTFSNNGINVSSLSRFTLNKSHIRDNSINASRIASLEMQDAQMSDNSIHGSSLDSISIQQGQLNQCEFHGSKISHLDITDQCAISDAEFHGAVAKNISLKNRSRVQNAKFHGIMANTWTLVASSVSDMELHGAVIRDFNLSNSHIQNMETKGVQIEACEMIDSTWRDIRVYRKNGKDVTRLKNVSFKNSSLQDITFEDCLFENVQFIDVHIRDRRLTGLHMKNKTIRSEQDLERELSY
ncbi:MAG: DUF2089 family protein [Bdellovibrionales bacterium]|jgi:hypothetical protein|nr:DUF2089 family protein [Bdellovibrionales bacterium]